MRIFNRLNDKVLFENNEESLSGANLRGANLRGANLRGAKGIIDGGQRLDGYQFVAVIHGNVVMIAAGCRWFTLEEARVHWGFTRGGTPLGEETQARLNMIEAVAKAREAH